jgi:hypothetical protein
MNENRQSTYMAKTVEGLWLVACRALGEDHLLTQAFETALRTGDPTLMERALILFNGSPRELRNRILWGNERGTSKTA